MSYLARLESLPTPIAEIVRATDSAGGAVIVFSPDDQVLLTNPQHRELMPCGDYEAGETYESLFWKLLAAGRNGNPAAKKDPIGWLARAKGSRINSANMDFVNIYDGQKFLVSHHRLDDGTSVQARLSMAATGLESYFSGVEANLGVTRAIRLRNEIRNLEAALDSLGLAVAIVDQRGSLLHANASFADMLDDQDGLTDHTGHGVVACDEHINIMFQQAVRHVANKLQPQTFVPIRRRRGETLCMAVSPGYSHGTAILAIARFGEDFTEVTTALKQVFGLTPAESEVIASVGLGQALPEVAGSRGVEMGTIYRTIDNAKKRFRAKQIISPDLPVISNLVTGIQAITRASDTRKH